MKPKSAASALDIETNDALFQHCGAAVVVIDRDDVLVEANEEAREVFGLSSASDIKLQSPALVTVVKKVRERGQFHVEELGPFGDDGRVLTLAAHPIGNGNGRVLIIAQDVTALRKLERVRRDFVANVSHELRTPLASIRAMAETLQGGALDDPSVSDRFLGTIVAETERLARIAEDLLILSDAESRPPERAALDLSDLLAEVVQRFEQQAARAHLRLFSNIESSLSISANRDQIEQALVNLVDNAIKYTPGGGQVTVEALAVGRSVYVSVRDTGIGIAQEHLPRLWERFYRVDKARSRESGGTGLGLSIVKNIVEAHSGHVEVDSRTGEGSVFTVQLPLRQAGAHKAR